MTDWPLSIPSDFIAGSYQETFPDLGRSTPMDAGPPKRKKRFDNGVTPFSGNIKMSLSARLALKVFYKTTVNVTGVFNFLDPLRGDPSSTDTIECRFTAPPRVVDSTPGSVIVEVQLEEMP